MADDIRESDCSLIGEWETGPLSIPAVPAVDTAVFAFTFRSDLRVLAIRRDGVETFPIRPFTVFECNETDFTVEFTLDDPEFGGSYYLEAAGNGTGEYDGQIEIMIGEDFGSADVLLSRRGDAPGRVRQAVR